MRFLYVTGLIVFTALSSCGEQHLVSYTSANQQVNAAVSNHAIDSIILPYREKMQAQMAEVIGYADSSLLSYGPESPLGNFAADAIFEAGFQYAAAQKICSDSNAIFCMLNFGGLRTSINKGAITRGDVYELMPFDNSIVIVELSHQNMHSLVNYLTGVKGQPVSNARFILDKSVYGYQVGPDRSADRDSYFVITSDYLAGGGDKMNFFSKPLNRWDSGIVLRDALIHYIQTKKQVPYYPVTGRMYFPR